MAGSAAAVFVSLKLPFVFGTSHVLTRGYNTPATHIGNDIYALDLATSGCSGWDEPILAAASGTVVKIATGHVNGESRSYGNQILVDHGGGVTSRYAHLNQVLVSVGDTVHQGQKIGTEGNTGTASGSVCPQHPGTHLHFVMMKDGQPYKPEPMSGYTDFTAGEEYISDNELYDPNKPASAPDSNGGTIDWLKHIFDTYWGNINDNAQGEDNTNIVGPVIPKVDPQKLAPPVETYGGTILNKTESVPVAFGQATVFLTIRAKNTGTKTWVHDAVSLNITGAQSSLFYNPSWKTQLRPALLNEASVSPGGTGTFNVTLTLPANAGVYTFQTVLVSQEGSAFTQIGGDTYTATVYVETPRPVTLAPQPVPPFLPAPNLAPFVPQPPAMPVETKKEESAVPKEGGASAQNGVNTPDNNSVAPTPTTTHSPTSTPTEEISTSTAPVGEDTVGPVVSVTSADTTGDSFLLSYTGGDDSGVASYEVQYLFPYTEGLPEESCATPDATVPLTDPMLSDYSAFFAYTDVHHCTWFFTTTTETSIETSFSPDLVDFPIAARVRGIDTMGNVGEWAYSDEFSFRPFSEGPGSVIISEIAWAGTASSSDAQWIELFNPSPDYVLVGGSTLEWGSVIVRLPQIRIPPNMFLVLERDTNDVIRTVESTVYHGALRTTGEDVKLFDQHRNIIDEINASSGWFGGSATTTDTMVRRSAEMSGSDPSSWCTQTSCDLNDPLVGHIQGIDGGGNNIVGSPLGPIMGFTIEF